jgi:hypothetical protein
MNNKSSRMNIVSFLFYFLGGGGVIVFV